MNELRIWIKDTAERVVVTFVISVLAVFAGGAATDWSADGGKKLLTAAGVAAAVAIKQAVLPKVLGLGAALDVVTRATWSAVQHAAMLVTGSAGFDWYSVTAWQTVAVAAFAAACSVVKGFLATRMDRPTITPASLAPTG